MRKTFVTQNLFLVLLVCASVVPGVVAQRLAPNIEPIRLVAEESSSGSSVARQLPPDQFFGGDAATMNESLEALRAIAMEQRNENWRPSTTQPGCESASRGTLGALTGLLDKLNTRVGGSRRLSTDQQQNSNHAARSASAGKSASMQSISGYYLPNSFVDHFVIIQTQLGNYYVVDIWGTYVQVIKVYPVDDDAEYFSKDPDENDIADAAIRLVDATVDGRGWNETPEQYAQRFRLSTATVSCAPPEISIFVTIGVVQSSDPNDKLGPVGVSENRYIADDGELDYTIRFENMPDATAPAQEVLIRDTLDTSAFDLESVQLGEITFGDRRVAVPRGRSSFSTRVALDAPLELIIDAHLVPETGVLTWRFVTVDTNTGDLPANPLDGFLPPNVTSPEGEGSVSFSAELKDNVSEGAVITNMAQIFFDLNEPIDTPPWVNIVDATAPSSSVTGLANEQIDSTFTVTWGGSDAGAGISVYDVYFAVNGGEFKQWLTRTYLTENDFLGARDSTYSFYSIAYDAAGNIEPSKSSADATTDVRVGIEDDIEASGLPLAYHLDNTFPNPTSGNATIRYGLPDPGPVSIAVYDMQGREVLSIVNGETRSAGWHTEAVDASQLASGVYIYRLTAGNTRLVKKMTVIR